MNAYFFVIAASLIIIASYFFNLLAKRSNIPSVLMLITLGIILKQVMVWVGMSNINWFPYLEVLGIVGLIMIVLEAALDLELKKEKWPILWKSFVIALLSLILTGGAVSYLLIWVLDMDLTNAILYALPLSIMSSAIVIPSVVNLDPLKKEFMIYESTFSDILGIMLFYFVISGTHASSASEMWIGGGVNILLTVVVSFLVSYGLIFLFQNIKSQTKLFLLIAVLLLMYSVSKMLHLSSLLIILVFGLILKNRKLFFRGKLAKYLKEEVMSEIFKDLYLITMESSFVVRTFFFVIFGITISLASLFKFKVIVISLTILIITYGIRFLLLKIFVRKKIDPQVFLAPRGLITVLLYYAIPQEFRVKAFDQGILLFVIIVTSIVMAWSLIRFSKKEKLRLEQEELNLFNDQDDTEVESDQITNANNDIENENYQG
jgi:Kef-type K+ transport system membrane component KefB